MGRRAFLLRRWCHVGCRERIPVARMAQRHSANLSLNMRLTLLVLKPGYSGRTSSILWLLMSQVISSHGIDHIRQTDPCPPQAKFRMTRAVLMLRNGEKFKHILCFLRWRVSTTKIERRPFDPCLKIVSERMSPQWILYYIFRCSNGHLRNPRGLRGAILTGGIPGPSTSGIATGSARGTPNVASKGWPGKCENHTQFNCK